MLFLFHDKIYNLTLEETFYLPLFNLLLSFKTKLTKKLKISTVLASNYSFRYN
jgi:hypothetical protein